MKPPFSITAKMLSLCADIGRLLGQVEGLHFAKPEPKLRKTNRIRTIQASLAIEGNTLNLDQVTAILDGRRVAGAKREILEVQSAVVAYDRIASFKPSSTKSLREAHGILLAGLAKDAGQWRAGNVGVFQGSKVTHAAPQAKRVPKLMDDLFAFIKSEKETHPLVLSAVCHYEIEFIHPFSDGNGRLGRLWQTVLLAKFHPLFEFTPVESAVKERQADYYRALGLSDKKGDAAPFIEFSLETIYEALESLKESIRPVPLGIEDRLEIARQKLGRNDFSRKDYLGIFKTISTATASRDLALGVAKRLLRKTGEKSQAKYRFIT